MRIFIPCNSNASGVSGAADAGGTLQSRPMRRATVLLVLAPALAAPAQEKRQQPFAPDRRPDEGEGPFKRLVIRGATLIDGTGAPPQGPVDLVIEGNRIRERRSVGYPHVPIKPDDRPKAGEKEIDGSHLWVLPGFIDLHGHIGGVEQGTTAEYVFKLWMAHGVTTVREPGSGNGVDWTLHERDRSAKNEIVAPRIVPYVVTSSRMGDGGPLNSPEQARKLVQCVCKKGGAGIKILGGGAGGDPIYDPESLAAMLDEAKKQGLGSTTHLAQMGVARMNILDAARLCPPRMAHHDGL